MNLRLDHYCRDSMILELARVLKLLELYTVGVRVRRRGRTFCLEAPLLKKHFLFKRKESKQLLTMDLLALASMKNAAKCDT